ncbi:MAG: TetR family transcriptional regulator C-terminal domain-containing protein [Clostridia bacterium]|nr:TetR family transcriptional regulator C-terminal domain-containing protein [Clostridia bacterium]MBR3431639.1 TetR family transcriptional regulator C-terminal domain-containing protein [Clostridia bacterium]MBR4334764.1 TetR family transcriptional regulator C-terminal domain-containing protein [Clostridia bacterium]
MMKSPAATEKKEDRRVRRTKKLLTQALTQLLQEKQINEITVKELTDLADMNRGTFYLYYKDMFDMLEKIEDGMFEALDAIVSLHEHDDVSQQTKPILLDLFRFIQDNQEMCRVLLSPHGDMNFLHRLNEVVREKCLKAWPNIRKEKGEADFDYHYSFVVFGCAGIIRAWVNRNCSESAEKMAEMAYGMILRGSLADV